MWFVALLAGFLIRSASAFDFSLSPSTPSQCGEVTVTWTGGQPPFRFLIIPPSFPMETLTIPDSAFSDNQGTFRFTVDHPATTNVLFAMSDATGLTAGGITALMRIGSGGTSCNPRNRSPDFFFSLDGTLRECSPYPFTFFSGAIQPVTIQGFIPQGDSFTFQPTPGDTATWNNNRPAGTSIIFAMFDSQGRSGGSSNVMTVQPGDSSCLTSTTSTTSRATTTTSGGVTTTPRDTLVVTTTDSSGSTLTITTSVPPTSPPGSGPGLTGNNGGSGNNNESGTKNTAAIVGGVVGGICLLGALIFFVLWRRAVAKRIREGEIIIRPTLDGDPRPSGPPVVQRPPAIPGVSPFSPPKPQQVPQMQYQSGNTFDPYHPSSYNTQVGPSQTQYQYAPAPLVTQPNHHPLVVANPHHSFGAYPSSTAALIPSSPATVTSSAATTTGSVPSAISTFSPHTMSTGPHLYSVTELPPSYSEDGPSVSSAEPRTAHNFYSSTKQ